MPEKNTDAEAVTTEPVEATGNVEPAVTLEDFQMTQKLLLEQEALIQRLADQVEKLSKTAQSDVLEPIADPADFGPQPVAEGWRRYQSRYSELTLMRIGDGTKIIEGLEVEVPLILGKPIDFTGGVYETDDPVKWEFIENHSDFNVTFWRDDYAIRRHSMVEVTRDIKTSAGSPRTPLAAPMAP